MGVIIYWYLAPVEDMKRGINTLTCSYPNEYTCRLNANAMHEFLFIRHSNCYKSRKFSFISITPEKGFETIFAVEVTIVIIKELAKSSPVVNMLNCLFQSFLLNIFLSVCVSFKVLDCNG